ncbi:L-threonylcarbamoyladenylate synthase [Paenibacillus sp. GCM10023252]|uniref:L-threonylcarbamoyladenylate synthase n=1 Tax=Paenibacillus sp. GCM10023252 TaxID=3252649 RepID=UPI00360A6867
MQSITTQLWHINSSSSQEGDIQQSASLHEAAVMLREGKLVAFPTETVYGLGADARSTQAVQGIFEAKGRPSDNPLIVHIGRTSQLDELVLPYSGLASRLMAAFWPGPLTMVLPMREGSVSPLVTAGLSTVAVRIPDHPVALQLLELAGCPVAAPSANLSGRPSPTKAEHVLDDLRGRLHGVVDGGATGVGVESTVIELVDERTVRILRPGGVTSEQLAMIAQHVLLDDSHGSEIHPQEVQQHAAAAGATATGAAAEAPRSPGMKYTHYAPQGMMEVVLGSPEQTVLYIRSKAAQAQASGYKTGILAFNEHAAGYEADLIIEAGSLERLEEAAHLLYDALREFDKQGIQMIWAEGCEPEGIGMALMNRMLKAAGNRVQLV